jgi:hypothetical protein
MIDGDTGRELVAALERWSSAGAVWRVVERSASSVTVALLRCDAGEEVQRFTSADRELLLYLGDRRSSDD